ncbi:hypothetical protein DFH09DRAFT_1296618 [Mycena vulgaris]|nr:hypothetical protein DFH09DRAFT_1296618 [Mycena vulgaris]
MSAQYHGQYYCNVVASIPLPQVYITNDRQRYCRTQYRSSYMPPLYNLRAALRQKASQTDRRSYIYAYWSKSAQRWKFGRSEDPPRRMREWSRQCGVADTAWCEWVWEVPFGVKFERLLHTYFKIRGEWAGPIQCKVCGVRHKEFFNLLKRAGLRAFNRAVLHLLALLKWPVVRVSLRSKSHFKKL